MKRILVISALATTLLSGCFVTDAYDWAAKKISNESPKKEFVLHTASVDATLSLEIADTEQTREKGLMDRDSVAKDGGMWFVFDDEAPRVFWMKNTRIPLDIIFFNAKKEVVDVIPDMSPCATSQCTRYPSSVPAMFALEVPAGYAQEKDIAAGNTIEEKEVK